MTTQVSKPLYCSSPLPFLIPRRASPSAPASLIEAVQTAVQPIAESWLHPIVARTASPAFQPRVMLVVLTYCYAKGLYAGSEILRYLKGDKAFSRVCQHQFPNRREIESFRQHNSYIIEQCLIAALRFLAEQKAARSFVTRAHETFIAEEAKRAIIMAAHIASLEEESENEPPVAVSDWWVTASANKYKPEDTDLL